MREAWISDEVDGRAIVDFGRAAQALEPAPEGVVHGIHLALQQFGVMQWHPVDRDAVVFIIPKGPGMVSPPMDAVDLVNAIVAGDAEQALAIARRVIA